MIAGDPLLTLRSVRQAFRGALEDLHKLPDPAAFNSGVLRELSRSVEQVDRALAESTPKLTASKEWQEELNLYRDTLRELHEKLSTLDTHLRVRRAQMAQARTHLGAAQSWANLIQRIG